jgi:ABC-type Na+ efflux pump permease subunit
LQVVSDTPSLGSLSLLPASLCASLIADSIAGERERLGLETMRASHAPLGAILWGKAALGWLGGLLPGLAGLGIACVFTQQPFWPWAASMAGTTLACAAFAARVAASAPTVRSAAQLSVLGSFFAGIGMVLLPVFLPPNLVSLQVLAPLGLGLASLGLLGSARRAWART